MPDTHHKDSDHWSELAAKAQAGDTRSYNQLLKELAPYIRAVLIPSLSNTNDVEDVVQEILISVHKSLKTYTPDRPFKPWLFSIINFRRTDYLRRHYAGRQDKKVSADVLEFTGEYVTNPTHAGEWKDVEAALATLPERQRKIFEKVKIQGDSIQEVAEELDMNESAVKVSAHRAMQKLKGILGG